MSTYQLSERNDDPYRLLVSASEISSYVHDLRCYFWAYYLNLSPPQAFVKQDLESPLRLTFGTACHGVWESVAPPCGRP
jgi:hypothetical protein